MAIFTVHVPSHGEDALERAERTAFVRDGFSVWALLFGPLYLLRHRAWSAAAAWIVVVVGGLWLCRLVHLPGWTQLALLALVALFTGLEASSLRRFVLHRRGLDVADVVEGANREAGERSFFRRATLEGLPARRTVTPGSPRRSDEPVIGFFPGPDGY